MSELDAVDFNHSVCVHALCTSYYHLLQAIAFTLSVGRGSSQRRLVVYSTPFLGRTRIDPGCLELADLPLEIDFRTINHGGPVSPFCIIRRIAASLIQREESSYVISANTINLWFVSYLNRAGVRGRFGVFEDGIGAYGSPLYRARDQAKLSGRNLGLILTTELFRLCLTKLAVRHEHNVRVLAAMRSASRDYLPILRALLDGGLFKADLTRFEGPVLVLLSQPLYLIADVSKEDYHELVRQVLEIALSKGMHVIIKPHPNEDLPVDLKSKVVDFAGPAEALVAKLRRVPVCVAGFSSTALLSCRRLFGVPAYRIETSMTDPIYAELDGRMRSLLIRETKSFPAEYHPNPTDSKSPDSAGASSYPD